MEDLFVELLKIYMPNPNKGFISKLKKFIGLDGSHTVNIKKFSNSIR